MGLMIKVIKHTEKCKLRRNRGKEKNLYKLVKCFIRHGNGGRIGFGRVSKFVELGRPYVP